MTTTQTADKVAASLLKQLAWPPEEDRHNLQTVYENLKLEGNRPDREKIVELFVKCAQPVKVKVLFDALDECKDEELGEIYKLIQSLLKGGIGVYITTRTHIVGHLRTTFPDAVFKENIKADEGDIRAFLEERIQGHREHVEPDFMNDIIYKILKDAQGMYIAFCDPMADELDSS